MKTKQKLIDKTDRKCVKAYRQARKNSRGKAWAMASWLIKKGLKMGDYDMRYKAFIGLGFHFVIASSLALGYCDVLKDYPPLPEFQK